MDVRLTTDDRGFGVVWMAIKSKYNYNMNADVDAMPMWGNVKVLSVECKIPYRNIHYIQIHVT